MEFFRRYWRQDRLFPFAVAGLVLAAWAFRGIDSPFGQKFADFITINRDRLLYFFGGAALFIFGCAGRAGSMRTGGNTVGSLAGHPRISRGRKWLRRTLGFLIFLAGAASFGYVIWDVMGDLKIPVKQSSPMREWVHHPAGMDGPAALLVATVLLVTGAALCETRRRGWWRDLGFGRHQQGLKFWRRDAPWLILVLLVWFLVNVAKLETRPGFFTGDEANVILQGRMAFDPSGKNTDVLTPFWHNVWEPFGSCVIRALVRELFPNHRVFGSRIFSLIVGTGLLVVMFIFSRAQFGRYAAWITLMLAGSNHILLSFFRRGYTNVDSITIVACSLLAFMGAWRSRRVSLGLLAGLIAGFAHYTYSAALVILPVLIFPVIIYFIRDPGYLRRRWAVVLAILIGYAVTSSPNHIYFRRAGDEYWYRNMVFLLSKDNMEVAFKTTQTRNLPGMLLSYSWPAVGGLLLWHQSSFEYDFASRGMVIMDRDSCAIVLLGLLATLALWRRRLVYLMLPLWWIGVMTCGSLLTRDAPYVPRTLGMFLGSFLMAGWVLGELVGRARRLGGWWLAAPVFIAAFGWAGQIAHRNMRHFYVEHLGNLNNLGYSGLNMGLTEFFNGFPRDAHLVHWTPKGSWDSFDFPAILIYDTNFSKELFFDSQSVIPSPNPDKRTAYVVDVRNFPQVDVQLAVMFPGVTPLVIRNPYKPNDPPTHHVYWVDKGVQPAGRLPAQDQPGSVSPEPPPQPGAMPAAAETVFQPAAVNVNEMRNPVFQTADGPTSPALPAADPPTSGSLQQ